MPLEVVLLSPELLEIEEEEGPVPSVVDFGNADRPADREPIIVAAHGIADVLARFVRGLRAGVGEWQAGIQSFVHEIVVGAAVEGLVPDFMVS